DRSDPEPPPLPGKKEPPPTVTKTKEDPVPPAAPEPKPKKSAAKAKDPARRELTYEKHVLPIMQRACLSCHGAPKKRGGLDLRTYSTLLRGGDSGAGV